MKNLLPESPDLRRKIVLGCAFLGVLIFGWIIGRVTGAGDSADHDHDHAPTLTVEDAEATEYTCSMHPQVRQPNPGKCPICGMDLIPVSSDRDDEPADLPRLSVSPRAAALMAIQTWPAESRAVDREVRLFGSLDYDETRVIDVVVLSDGRIDYQYGVNFMNAPVRRGQPIAEFYSPSVLAAAEQLLIARDAVHAGSRQELLASARRKLLLQGVSERQVDQILETGEVPETYTIYSPIDGYIREMGGHVGHWLKTGDHLNEIADYSSLWVWLDAFESDIAWIQPGQQVTFNVEAFPGQRFEGRVDFIEPVIMGARRTLRIRANVPNPQGRLKPGMFVQARIAHPNVARYEGELVVPASAPLVTGQRAVVYVQLPGRDRPTFEAREVVLGPRAGEFFVVREGLMEGELVVTNGNFKIDSELQIRGRPSMMSPDGQIPMPLHDHGPGLPTPADEPEPHFHIETQAVEVSRDVGAQLAHLVHEYLHVAQTLANDEKWGAEVSLRRLRDAFRAVDPGRLPSEAREPWQQLRREAGRVIDRALAGEGIEHYREHLQSLTHIVEATVEHFRTDQVPALYEAYCPMAHDAQGGTWLQAHDRIENPYLGADMFRCGEIRGEVM